MSGPVQPGLRALDAIYPDDPGIRMAARRRRHHRQHHARLRQRHRRADALRQAPRPHRRGDAHHRPAADGTEVLGGLKMANGENPKGYGRTSGQAPFTRMKVAALQREQFVKAREYQAKWDAYRRPAAKERPPDRDLALEPLVEVLERKRTVHFHCHRADDLMTAVRLAEEFGFELVLQHATEGYRVADDAGEEEDPGVADADRQPRRQGRRRSGLLEENAAVLDKAGVPVAINTDDFITESRFFLRTGAIAVRGGMTEAAALQALTITAGEDAAPRPPPRLAGAGQGRRLRRPERAAVQRLHAGAGDVHRRQEGVRPVATSATGPTRPAASPCPTGDELPDAVAPARPPEPVTVPPMPAADRQRRPRPPTVLVVRAGRVHTAGGRADRATASSSSRTARSRRSARRPSVKIPAGACRADGRGGDAGADRRRSPSPA